MLAEGRANWRSRRVIGWPIRDSFDRGFEQGAALARLQGVGAITSFSKPLSQQS